MPDVEAELRARAESDGVEFFFAMFVDMHGKPCAKMIPVTRSTCCSAGRGFAGFAAGPMGQSPADPDMIAVPDPASYTLVPWQPGLAVLQCDIEVEGEPWPYTPRLILKGMLEKAARARLRLQRGLRGGVLPGPRGGTRAASRWPTRSTGPGRPATTPRA